MSEHEVSWDSWQAVCKERDALRAVVQELVCTIAFMLGATYDKWTELERHRIHQLIDKYDQNKAALRETK